MDSTSFFQKFPLYSHVVNPFQFFFISSYEISICSHKSPLCKKRSNISFSIIDEGELVVIRERFLDLAYFFQAELSAVGSADTIIDEDSSWFEFSERLLYEIFIRLIIDMRTSAHRRYEVEEIFSRKAIFELVEFADMDITEEKCSILEDSITCKIRLKILPKKSGRIFLIYFDELLESSTCRYFFRSIGEFSICRVASIMNSTIYDMRILFEVSAKC